MTQISRRHLRFTARERQRYLRLQRPLVSLTAQSFKAIADNCPLLIRFEAPFCDSLTEERILAFATRCTSLTALDFAGCHDAVTDAAMNAIADYCPNLKELNVKFLSDASMLAIARP